MSVRNWLITGASSGMGRALTEIVLSKGDRALAGVRKPDSLKDLKAKYPDSLVVGKLDVTKLEDIKSIFALAKESFGRLDVVFSGAGFSFVGEVEGSPEKLARDMFDTNFWGSSNVVREAAAFLRDVNKPQGGRIISISSTTAITSFPASAYYSASKYALEGLLTAFAKELDPEWNIKSTVVETGVFLTRAANKDAMTILPPHPAYTSEKLFTNVVRGFLSKGVDQGNDPVEGMRIIYEYLSSLENPPIRFPLGPDAVTTFKTAAEELKSDAEAHEAASSIKI